MQNSQQSKRNSGPGTNTRLQPTASKRGAFSIQTSVARRLRHFVLHKYNDKMRSIIVLGILIVFLGNAQAELKLSENTDKNEKIIKEFIPIGTTAHESMTKMKGEGLTCKLERGHIARLHKGNVEIGQVGPVDIVWCDKQQIEGLMIRKWQIILFLDKNDQIIDHSITTGLTKH